MTDTLLRAPIVAHRPSHRRLLIHPRPVDAGDVSAVVVPTIRPAATMRDSLRLGRELGRPVVALCSAWSSAESVLAEAKRLGAAVIAVDVPKNPRLPRFEADRLLAAEAASTASTT